MTPKHTKLKFPLLQYLNQPLFNSNTKLVLNPRRFAHLYRVGLLKRCWTRDCDAKRPYSN
nr:MULTISPECIES: hypothetical protein [unclassified Fischerella]